MKAVLDCNVFISALIRLGGPPALILSALRREEFEFVLSPGIIAEYRRAVNYPKIRARLVFSSQELQELERDLTALAFWVEPELQPTLLIFSDPSDDIYLLAAVESEADYIVSGDRHLLVLKRYGDIPIISPRDFLNKIS